MERLGCDLTHDFVRVVDIQGVYHGNRSLNLSWSRAFCIKVDDNIVVEIW